MLRDPPPPARKAKRAAWFWYLVKIGFGARISTPTFGYSKTGIRRPRPDMIRQDLLRTAGRLHSTVLECHPWQDILQRYDGAGTLFYIDPPYVDMPYYRHNFSDADHQELAAGLEGIEGKFLLSYNDHPLIHKLYPWAHVETLRVPYTANKGTVTYGEELLIANFEVRPRQVLTQQTLDI